MSIEDILQKIISEKLDKVNKDAVMKKFANRKDQDIDNDGEVDDEDRYLHTKRKAITKAMKKEDVELQESHFEVGDEVECIKSGMEGEVVKVDPKEKGKYYTVKREDGKMMKYAPDELKALSEEVQLDEADGWIAMYNGKKLEITKSDAKDLYGAKMYAAKELKVPKSKMGLLAIKPAYNESINEQKKFKGSSADDIRTGMPGFIGMDFAKKAEDDDVIKMAELMDKHSEMKNKMKPIVDEVNKLRKKYRLKPIK